MSELLWIKAGQVMAPATDEAVIWLSRKKQGATIWADVKEMRNGAFFRKWWSLVSFAFDTWSETCEPIEYKGQPVLPDFDRFRKDVTIIAGFYRPVWNVKGEMRIEPESLKWARMTEETFGKLYSATLLALTQKIFDGKRCRRLSPDQLRNIHEDIWKYGDNWSGMSSRAA